MTDPLDVIVHAVREGSQLPFDWVVEHAPDGDLDATIARLWCTCKDPETLEALALKAYTRKTLAEGRAAVAIDLLKRLGVPPHEQTAVVFAIRSVAAAPAVDWRIPKDVRRVTEIARAASHRVAEILNVSFQSVVTSLLSRAIHVSSYGSGMSGAMMSLAVIPHSYMSKKFALDDAREEAKTRLAKILRRAWRAPTAAQLGLA